MEHSHLVRGKRGVSSKSIIVRDALIFVLCMLISILVVLVSMPNQKSAAVLAASAGQQTQVKPAAADDSTQQNQVVITQITSDTASTATAQQAVVESEAEPQESTQTENSSGNTTDEASSQQEEAIALGDFSSTFPKEDTGVGALLSHQSDTVRISIQKEQAFGATYFVADVWVKNIESLRTAFAKKTYGGGREMPLQVASEANAIFAVTGDYYGARDTGVVVRNGTLYRDVMGDDVCVLKKDGTLTVYQKGSFSVLDSIDDTVWQAWAFGPALVENGVVCDVSGSRIKVKNPRCAIGTYAPGHYCFIVVDGRQSNYSEGMTLDELAQTFQDLGCQTAYNLDGGATAMMVFEGALVNQPVNGGRSSSDIICFS